MSNTAGSKWIRPEKRLSIYFRDGLACVYCGAGPEDGPLTLDHLTPREVGGSHHETNLVTACLCCNSARRDLPLRAWLATLRDRGVNTTGMAKRIRRLARTPLDLEAGKRALRARKENVR